MSKLKAKQPTEVQPGHTKSLIFGASGVGKTTFALQFPRPFFIDTEGGADLKHYQKILADSGGVYLGPSEGALDFGTVIEQMQALATEAHPYKTLVIDSITKLFATTVSNESERLGAKDAFGASKKPANAWMRRLVKWSQKLDMNIILVAHEVTEWGVDQNTGQRAEIGKIADIWPTLIYELDLTLQAVKRGPARVAIVRKSRLTGFEDQAQFPLDFAEFATRYGKDFIEAAPKQITLATKDQLAEIRRLLETVKVTEQEIEKLFTKASVDRWEELTTEQAAATVAWLAKKVTG